jgi:hypothetical protein
MHEQHTVSALIDRIVAGAHIPSRSEREDIRRELWTHFEEADDSPEAVQMALRRFGPEALLTESFRRVYRWDYAALYLLKIVASIMASLAAALLIEVLVNLRVEAQAEVWRLAPGFSHGAGLSVGVVLGLVTAWEVARRPFNRVRAAAAIIGYAAVCLLAQALFSLGAGTFVTPTLLVALGYSCSKLPRRPVQLLATCAAFAAFLYGTHLILSVTFGPSRAIASGAVMVAVWSSTAMILARFDHAFGCIFETTHSRSV